MKANRYFGSFGGLFVPEMMVPAMEELEAAFLKFSKSAAFQKELQQLLSQFAGRPTPLYHAAHMSEDIGCSVFLKREDLLHTGAHKINNTVGQALLAKKMGKTEIIAETGAGQHGVASAAACALLGLKLKVFMGAKDVERQKLNVHRMKLFGAEVVPVTSGSKTLKDAINEALRYFLGNVKTTYYLVGSVVGPHPYPMIVQHFHKIIGAECKAQLKKATGKLPTHVVACVGGGSNAIGIFDAFLKDAKVQLIGVEPAGTGNKHGLTLNKGSVGVFQGSKSYVLQDPDGQIQEAHSISAGLDYPGVGPVHSQLMESGRATYVGVSDDDAVGAVEYLSKTEGILPALETAHAISYVLNNRKKFKKTDVIVINLSGRGDKDVHTLMEAMK